MPRDRGTQGRPGRDLALYGRLISWGIAEADACGTVIDHVTARRMALWLLPRAQDQGEVEFMRGLIRFAQTGAVTHELKNRLRSHARSAGSPLRPHAARLLRYAVARGADNGPIGQDFGAVCDQIDRADAMLEDLRNRVQQGHAVPKPADPPGQHVIAMARHDPASHTVSLLLDETSANAAIHAISTQAADREARTREIEQYARDLPEDSYGRHNRETIAARETRIASRLRTIERAYRTALDHEATPALEPPKVPPTDRALDRELELG